MTEKHVHPNLRWIYLVVLSLVWGSSFILMKKGLVVFRPDQVAAIRMSIACLATFPIIAHRIRTVPVDRLKYISVVGIVGSGIPAILFATAQTQIHSALAGMLNSLTPLFTLLVGIVVFRNKFSPRQIWGVIVGFLGAAGLILARSKGGGESHVGAALMIVLATLMYGVSVNTIKHYLAGVDSMLITGTALLFVGIPYGIYLFSTDFLQRLNEVPHAWASLGYILTLGFMGTAVSSVLYFHMVKISSPLFASAVTYFMPIISLGWGLTDGEGINPLHIVSMVTILAGVALMSWQRK